MVHINFILYCGLFALLGIQTVKSVPGLKSGIVISSFVKNTLQARLKRGTHLFFVPATPSEFIKDPSLISRTQTLSKNNAPLSKFTAIGVDHQLQNIYLYDDYTANIFVLNKFQAIYEFHKGVSRSLLVSIAVDWVSHNVYWVDPMLRWIVMKPGFYDANQRKIDQYKIIMDNLEGPRAIAVDPNNGYLFYSDVGATAKILRASLTGENPEVIVSQNVLNPVDIEVDVESSQIIWVDERRDTIECADLDGENRRIIRRQPHTAFLDVAIYGDILGIIDAQDSKLKFFNKTDGGPVGRSIQSNVQGFWGVGFYFDETQPQQINTCLTKMCTDMCISNSTHASCVCREGTKLDDNKLTCSEDTGSLHRAIILAYKNEYCMLDVRSVISSNHLTNKICRETHREVLFMDIDSLDRKMIFASTDGLYEIQIGADATPTRLVAVSDPVTGLALDWTDKNVYWSVGAENGSILVFSRQTLNVATVHNKILDHPKGLLVLPQNKKLVWISGGQDNPQILMSDVDGAEIFEVVQPETLIYPQALAVDSHETRLFWSDNGFIRSCKLDGSDVTDMKLALHLPLFLAAYKGYFLYSTTMPNSVVYSLSTAKPYREMQKFSTGNAALLTGLKVLDVNNQPSTQNPCNILNGGCEHICLYSRNKKTCQCNFGFTLEEDELTCTAESLDDDFILVADWTHNEIYQVSMVTSDIFGIDVDGIDQPAALAFNHKTQEVIWGETTTKTIKSAFINGLNYTTLLDTGNLGSHPDRFAIDFTSGNIYYTSVNQTYWGFTGVGLLSPTGKHKKLIENGKAPRDIVVDPEAGLLFWTDHSHAFPFVKRADMDGNNIKTIVTKNIKWPNGLAIDYEEKHLYLTDGLLNNIQRCTYDGLCEVIYSDPAAHMMDIDLLGDFLYFTAWNRPYIAKMHKTNISLFYKLIERPELGRLDSISVYNSTEMNNPVSQACSENEGLGECSTFCLPTPTGFTCACEDGISLRPDKRTCTNVNVTDSAEDENIAIDQVLGGLQLGGVLDAVISGSELDAVKEQSDLPSEHHEDLFGAIQRRRRSVHAFNENYVTDGKSSVRIRKSAIYDTMAVTKEEEGTRREITLASPNISRSTVTPKIPLTATTIVSAFETKDVSNSITMTTTTDSSLISSSASMKSVSASTLSRNQTTSRNTDRSGVHTKMNVQTTVSPEAKIPHENDVSIFFTDKITDGKTGHHLVTRTSSRTNGKDFQVTASMATKTPQSDVFSNQSQRLKGGTSNSWRIPLIASVVTICGVVVVVTILWIKKRRTTVQKRLFTPQIRSQGQENPMYENLIDIEQEHVGELPVLALSVPDT